MWLSAIDRLIRNVRRAVATAFCLIAAAVVVAACGGGNKAPGTALRLGRYVGKTNLGQPVMLLVVAARRGPTIAVIAQADFGRATVDCDTAIPSAHGHYIFSVRPTLAFAGSIPVVVGGRFGGLMPRRLPPRANPYRLRQAAIAGRFRGSGVVEGSVRWLGPICPARESIGWRAQAVGR